MNTPEYSAWTQKAKAQLDASAQNLDAATLSRLNGARQAALAQRHRHRLVVGWLLPTGLASACVLLLAFGVWQTRVPPHHEPTSVVTHQEVGVFQADDMEMVDGDDNLDLYQNLEFYAWLDAQERDGDG